MVPKLWWERGQDKTMLLWIYYPPKDTVGRLGSLVWSVSRLSYRENLQIIFLSGLCGNGDTRLVDSREELAFNEGKVEICFNAEWQTVCGDGWTNNNTQVVCRSLGFNDTPSRRFCCFIIQSTSSQLLCFIIRLWHFRKGIGSYWTYSPGSLYVQRIRNRRMADVYQLHFNEPMQ